MVLFTVEWHYLSLAKTNYEKQIKDDSIRSQKYTYNSIDNIYSLTALYNDYGR